MNKNGFLSKVDQLICYYLGFDKEEVKVTTVQIANDQLIITNTTSFKRHVMKENWHTFSATKLKHIASRHKDELGVAMGKAIAKNLIISFDKTSIRRN